MKEIIFPKLEISDRLREYNKISEKDRGRIILEYLTNPDCSHRSIDQGILDFDPTYTHGFISMGVLHAYGLTNSHKGIFTGLQTEEVLDTLNNISESSKEVNNIINTLVFTIYELEEYNTLRTLESSGRKGKAFSEGKRNKVEHFEIERSQLLIKSAKRGFKDIHGTLYCEICGFNFESLYGDLGSDFIEGHHKVKISDHQVEHEVSVDDIAMVCSNCHRIIHRTDPMITIEELKSQITIRNHN